MTEMMEFSSEVKNETRYQPLDASGFFDRTQEKIFEEFFGSDENMMAMIASSGDAWQALSEKSREKLGTFLEKSGLFKSLEISAAHSLQDEDSKISQATKEFRTNNPRDFSELKSMVDDFFKKQKNSEKDFSEKEMKWRKAA